MAVGWPAVLLSIHVLDHKKSLRRVFANKKIADEGLAVVQLMLKHAYFHPR